MKQRLVLVAGGLMLIAILSFSGILLFKTHQNNTPAEAPIGQPVALDSTSASSALPLSAATSANGSQPAVDYSSYDQYKTKTEALFRDIQVGTGPEVKVGSKVAINYHGYLTSGKEFDETYSRNQPFLFTEGEHKVVLGLEEAAAGMKVGGKRRFIIPPAAGYGDKGYGPIPGGAVLIFDVELVASQ